MKNIIDKVKGKKEIKRLLKKENPRRLKKAMICAEDLCLYGVAAKLALKQNNFEKAGEYYEKFGDYRKSLENYLKSNKQCYLGEVLDVAQKTKDAKLVLKAIRYIAKQYGNLKDCEQAENYSCFSRGDYKSFDNFEEVNKEVYLDYTNELLERRLCFEKSYNLKRNLEKKKMKKQIKQKTQNDLINRNCVKTDKEGKIK